MQPNMPLDPLLDAVRANAALPDALAEATPPRVSSSPDFFALEIERIVNCEWHCVGREDEVAESGEYRTLIIGRDPVVVLRDREGRLRAMSNICRHRMMSLLEGAGRLTGRISCPSHAWTYTFDGQLVGAPHMRENFDKRQCRLTQFRLETLQGWVYVNLDPEAAPLAPLLERDPRHRVSEFETLIRVDEIWDTNWKILVQDFTEVDHLFAAHAKTVEPVLPTRLRTVLPGGAGFSLFEQGRMPGVAYEDGAAIDRGNPDLTDAERMTVPIFCVFPCHMVSISAERSFWLALQPLGVDRTKVRWGVDVFPGVMPEGADAEAREAELLASFHRINSEDKPIVARIARNASALAAEPGRLSPKEGTIWQFQQYLARKLCGPEDGQGAARGGGDGAAHVA